MDTFSIYRYMDLGIVHFKAFPPMVAGGAPVHFVHSAFDAGIM